MWDTIKDRGIGLRNDHVPTIHTGGRKWKSNYPHDKEVLDLIREKARWLGSIILKDGMQTNNIIRLETG